MIDEFAILLGERRRGRKTAGPAFLSCVWFDGCFRATDFIPDRRHAIPCSLGWDTVWNRIRSPRPGVRGPLPHARHSLFMNLRPMYPVPRKTVAGKPNLFRTGDACSRKLRNPSSNVMTNDFPLSPPGGQFLLDLCEGDGPGTHSPPATPSASEMWPDTRIGLEVRMGCTLGEIRDIVVHQDRT